MIYFKNFCKCHKVPPVQQQYDNLKKKKTCPEKDSPHPAPSGALGKEVTSRICAHTCYSMTGARVGPRKEGWSPAVLTSTQWAPLIRPGNHESRYALHTPETELTGL
jgi:hypothetical protein